MIKVDVELFRLKPIGLIMMIFAHFYALRETGQSFSWLLLVILFLATSLTNAATFALNQYYECDSDAVMERSVARQISSGRIKPGVAMLAGFGVFVSSLILQAIFLNTTTMLVIFLCGGLYVWTDTPLKSRLTTSTLIGSLPGYILPIPL